MSVLPPIDGDLPPRTGLLRLRSILHDRVTGLDSYQLHVDHLHLLADEGPLGVIAIEFPSLAGVEAAWGWEMSDRFLADVAGRLRDLRSGPLPASARITLDGVHGIGFLIFLHETGTGRAIDRDGLGSSADQVRRRLLPLRERTADGVARPRIDFTVGCGLVSNNPSARFERRLHQAIRDAWRAMLRESESLGNAATMELQAILRESRLTTHYQPIVDMEQGAIMGYEALTRGPAGSSFAVPEALFSSTNTTRMLSELDVACRREALRNARGFDPRMKLFLNSRPDTIPSAGAVDDGFLAGLAEIPLRPHNLVLEITERCPIDDFETFGRDLASLRRQGFLIAIDDVGTGYSSLQTISELQPDYLKIDISLIKNIHRSLIKQDLVHSLLQIASRIGAGVIAEGIETIDEYRALRRCGVRYGQGFFFAPPAPPFAELRRGSAGASAP
jgi:EAL domain-containing protein (putative c-di-GMP-specific phosphodiesterase class I)